MTLPPDYHMHTPLCHHAKGEPMEYAAHAVKIGLTEIGFSEHNPMREDDFDDWHMNLAFLDTYVADVQKARDRFPQLTIKLAMEVDFIPGHEEWIKNLRERHPWDYFIGSVHYVSDSWDLDNPKKLGEWKKRDPYEVWTIYFDRLRMAAESGLFEIIGHADLCKKFCFYPKEDCGPLYSRFLDGVKAANVAMEINTAGLRKDCKELYPNQQILSLARERNIPLTFGSDAHAPEEVGLNFAEGIASAKLAGYSQCCRFTRRQRELINF